MSISERTLRKWRKEALEETKELEGWDATPEVTELRRTQCSRILQMTQVLLDQHLLNKGK